MIGLSRNYFIYIKGRISDKPHGSINKHRQMGSFQGEEWMHLSVMRCIHF